MGFKEYVITHIKKKFWKRLSAFSLILAVWLLIDEFIKEGYLFNPADAGNPLSHEFWMLVLWVLAGVSFYIDERRGVKNGDSKSDREGSE